jgi:NADPH2:quinone reductase
VSETTTDTMRAWRVHQYGAPSDVLQREDVPVPEPGPGEVRVRAAAIPLNLNDIERITGGNMMAPPEFPYSPGMEVMGVVDLCGAGAEEWADKRVVATTKGAHGGFAEFALCTAAATFEMPDDVALPGAAALYFPFHLAWLGLFDRGDLHDGESVLIHAGAGGSGSAAIQLAQNVGARVFATAGTDEKVQLCKELGADIAINYTRDDFAEVVLDETSNVGVDVVFDNVGEAVFEKSMNCLAYNGRYVMMGFASNKAIADERFVVPRRVLLGNVKLCGVMFNYMDDATTSMLKQALGWNIPSRELGVRIHNQIVELVRRNAIKPVVGHVVDFDDLPAAIEAMASRNTTGRTIILL